MTSSFVYVTYIRTTPEKLWNALLAPEFTRQFWSEVEFVSGWTKGAPWRAMIPDGRVADAGEVLEVELHRRLILSWRNEFMPDLKADGYTTVTYELEPEGDMVKLTLSQEAAGPDSALISQMSQGWPMVMASLKSLLETGEPLSATTKWPEGY